MDLLVKGNPETGEIVIDDSEFSESYEGPDYRLPENKVGGVGELDWDVSVCERVLFCKGNPETGEVVIDDSEFSESYEGPDYRLPENKLLF